MATWTGAECKTLGQQARTSSQGHGSRGTNHWLAEDGQSSGHPTVKSGRVAEDTEWSGPSPAATLQAPQPLCASALPSVTWRWWYPVELSTD